MMGGFGRRSCEGERGMEDHMEERGTGWDSMMDRMVC